MNHPAPQWPFVSRWVSIVLFLLSSQAMAAEQPGAFLGAKHTDYPAWFKDSFLNLQEDIGEAKSQNKRVMLLFTQDNCPYCNALVERNLAQHDIETYLRKNFEVIAINMWGDREVTALDGKKMTEKQFASSLKVQFTPTILFFDEAGQTVLRLNGYLPPARFKTALEFVGQHKEKQTTYRDYVAANQPADKQSSTAGEMIQEDFFKAPPYNLSRTGRPAKPIAVFFEQKDCPSCVDLHRKVLPDPETRNIIAKFDAIQLDMWSDTPVITPQGKKTTARQWAKALDVKYAPSIIVFNAQGKEIIRAEAYFKIFHTQSIFTYVLSGAYKTEPNFQRYLSAKGEHIREQGKDVDIWRTVDEPAGKQ